jgi:hypothetical protein
MDMNSKKPTELPPARPINWEYKKVEDAPFTEIRTLEGGRIRIECQHEIIRGVTPEMLVWWFKYLDKDMIHNGVLHPRYHVWHPRDHIKVEVLDPGLNGAQVGSKIHAVEVLGRNPNYLHEFVATLMKLDASGFRMERQIEGHFSFNEKTWTQLAEGTQQNTVIEGAFSEEKAHVILRHLVEEIGNFEYFLPELFWQYNAAN